MISRRPLYLTRPSESDPAGMEVVRTYDVGYGFFKVAVELWRLAGRADRAEAFSETFASAWNEEPAQLGRAQIMRLRELLEGLEDALVGTVTDDQHLLSSEKVEELRDRTQTLDFNESFGADARQAVQHALVYIHHLRDILDEALARDAKIMFD